MGWCWAIASDPASTDWHIERLIRALGALGDVVPLDPAGLQVACGDGGLEVRTAGHRLTRVDAVLVGRVSPDADPELQLDAMRALHISGVPCVNTVDALLKAQDKLWSAALLAQQGVPTPACVSLLHADDLEGADRALGPFVAKPIFGSLGEGLLRCRTAADREAAARAMKHHPYLAQRWVETGGRDYRLFVVGGRVEGCIQRVAPPGEWRSNVARGGDATEAAAPRSWRDVAIAAVEALGLSFGGVDLAVVDGQPTVLEVNGFPSFRAVFQATGRDMAEAVARQVQREARARRRARRAQTTRA